MAFVGDYDTLVGVFSDEQRYGRDCWGYSFWEVPLPVPYRQLWEAFALRYWDISPRLVYPRLPSCACNLTCSFLDAFTDTMRLLSISYAGDVRVVRGSIVASIQMYVARRCP